jgi:hypothetical protein
MTIRNFPTANRTKRFLRSQESIRHVRETVLELFLGQLGITENYTNLYSSIRPLPHQSVGKNMVQWSPTVSSGRVEVVFWVCDPRVSLQGKWKGRFKVYSDLSSTCTTHCWGKPLLINQGDKDIYGVKKKLVGGFKHVLFSIIYGIILPID